MCPDYNPVKIWLYYGISDLYFGFINQANDVYRYGTFFYIMAAEKHLKAFLLYVKRAEYETLKTTEAKRQKVNKLVKKYSHNFKDMIEEVADIYTRRCGKEFLPKEYLGFSREALITAMNEGYMETRYPTILPTSRHFPAETAKGIYHSPLGSSFFTDFTQLICKKCWEYLASQNLNTNEVLTSFNNQYFKSEGYDNFHKTFIKSLE